jgi:tetratricopeptide (TPR) repeat protein
MRVSKNAYRFFQLAGVVLFTGLVAITQTASQPSTSSLLQDAAKEISASKLDHAEQDLQSILHSSPKEYRALDLLGVIRVLQHQETNAEQLFLHAVQTKPDFAPGHAHLGLLYLQLGNTENAVRELQEALRLDPARTDAARALVHILQDQAQKASEAGDWNSALSLLRDARKYASDNPDILYEFGVAALRLSFDEDAIEAFLQTLKLRKNDALAIYNLGRAFMELSKFEEARQQFAQYVEIRPNDSSGHCALGMTLAALEHSQDARTQFERSIALAPEQTESYYGLGLLELEAKNYDSATSNLRQVLDHDPKNALALTALGRLEFEQKHYPEALSLLQQAITADNALREAHYYLGLSFSRMGRKQESDKQLEIAMQLEHEEVQHRRTVQRMLDPGDLKPNQVDSGER